MESQLTVIEPQEQQLSVLDMKSRISLIQNVMRSVMIEDTHYGIVPGTEKPTLLKAGAEVLCVTFRLAPRYVTHRENLGNGHREYEVTTTLYHIPTGQIVGEGIGSCSTLESKYRYRYSSRLCPECHKDAIARSKADWGGGWYCNQRKGGCGTKFAEDAPEIINQETGRIENPDIADQYNTVLKMAIKRSLVGATLTTTSASDIFKQRDFDSEEEEGEVEPQPRQRETAQAVRTQAQPQSNGNPQPANTVTDPQIGLLMRTCKTFNVPEDVLKDYLNGLGIESRKDIPKKDFDSILSWVKANKSTSAAA